MTCRDGVANEHDKEYFQVDSKYSCRPAKSKTNSVYFTLLPCHQHPKVITGNKQYPDWDLSIPHAIDDND